MEAATRPERIALSRELSEFLVELSIAVQKHAMYPGEHPALDQSIMAVTRRAERLLEERPTLIFGVARRQLVIDGVATDPGQPVLCRLAEGLHRHHLGAISLIRGVTLSEMAEALRALSAEIERTGPLGLASASHRLEWPHIRLHPLTFDRLQLVELTPAEEGSSPKGLARAAELWVGLATAAMAGHDPHASADTVSTEPAVVACAINEHHGAAAYDQVVVGYLLQIAGELKTAHGDEVAALRQRTASLIKALRPETLRRLVEMGGDLAQRREFVLNAASGMAVDSVIEIVKAAADASGQQISHGLIRMLSKLAEHAEAGTGKARPLAAAALREQVERLLADWQLDDPNPHAYSKVLQQLATSVRSHGCSASTGVAIDAHDPVRIVQMSLEIGDAGPMVERAVDELLAQGRLGDVLRLLSSGPRDGHHAVAPRLLSKLASRECIAALAAREPLDSNSLDELLPHISLETYELLLDTLAASSNRSTRRKLLERLPQTDLDVAPLIVARLDDERWFVVRNMLVLLQRLRRLPEEFSPAPWTRHSDARVRYEAIQLQLSLAAEHDAAVAAALTDSDARVTRLGVIAVQHECPPPLTSLVAAVARNPGMPEDLRILAVRALGRSRESSARTTLLELIDGGRTLLGRPKLAPATPLTLASLRVLADAWPHDAAVAAMVALAATSADADVRDAVQRSVRL